MIKVLAIATCEVCGKEQGTTLQVKEGLDTGKVCHSYPYGWQPIRFTLVGPWKIACPDCQDKHIEIRDG